MSMTKGLRLIGILMAFNLAKNISMHVTLVHVYVKPEQREAFIAASTINHLASVQEPGNCRFDLLQAEDNPNHFILYEAYISAAAAAAHKETAHYLSWRETVADWMAEPRQSLRYQGLLPVIG